MFSSANQYTPFSYLLDEPEQVYDTLEDHHHHHGGGVVALQHPQSCNEFAPLLGGEFSDEQRFRQHREDFGMSLFYSDHEQPQGQQVGAYSNGTSRQGQLLVHHQQQDQEQQYQQLQQQQQEYEARLKNLQAPSPFFIQHMQNLQNQEEFSRIIMTTVGTDPSITKSTSSTSSSSGHSQTRQRMTPNQRTKRDGVLSPLPPSSNQVQTLAGAASASSRSMSCKNHRDEDGSSSSAAVHVHVTSVEPPAPRGGKNTKTPTMPMIYTPSSSMFHSNTASAMMYQEGAALNCLAGSSSGPVMQLTDPALHVPVLNNNRTYQEFPLNPTMMPTMMLPFGRQQQQQGFDFSVDPLLKRAQDITSSMGHFPSSFSHDATSALEKKNWDLEKKCFSRIVEAGISSSKNKSKLDRGTAASTSKSTKKYQEEDVLRPLSAYNFFFADERDRLLNAGKKEDTSVESYDKRKERLLAQHVAKDRSKRRPHRKTHGKITFTTLSKLIGKRWRQLPEVEKNFFKEVAKADLMRYHDELATGQIKKQDIMAPIALCYDQPVGVVV
jgi:hypothetical protein